ncbi:MAG TPA: hypothetical protein VN228_14965 [Pyrinomonadaceae bacterium]|nr:hypothetical protein [Pyrinomonadaceae bacterium]
MASDRVVGFATRAFPGRNMWWLVLEMEDGEKQEVAVPTGADLGAMCDILRRAREVSYSVDGGIIHTPFEPVGGAG